MLLVNVIPLSKVPLEGELTYFTNLKVAANDIVSVSIRNKNTLALVTNVSSVIDNKSALKNADFNLRKINDVKGPSVFNPNFISAVCDFAKYSIIKKNSVFAYCLPETIKENYDILQKISIKQEKVTNLKPEKLLFQANIEDRTSYYKTLIRELFALQKSIFIIVPREADINYFEQTLGRGIENFVITLYAGIPQKKLREKVEQISSSPHALLIIATPQYISIPREDIGVFILEHESSNLYKTMLKPDLDMRTFIEIFTTKNKTKLILSDTLLRLETIGRKEILNLGEVRPISFRINTDIEIKVLEKGRKKTTDSKWHPLDQSTLELLKQNHLVMQQSFVFTLRKGLATYTICKHCETPIFCPDCQAPLVLHTSKDKKKRMFVCNKCKHEKNPDTVCESCGSWNLIPLGVGTDRVYQEIIKIIPKEKVFELNKEVVKNKSEAEKLVKKFEQTPGAVLIGTEMALFYLKNKVEKSVMASFDSIWSIPNFKISEKVLHLILKTLDKTKHQLIIETRNTKDESILGIINGNLSKYIKSELEDRLKFEYPPYKRFVKITIKNEPTNNITTLRQSIVNQLESLDPISYGPNILLRLPNADWSLPELYPQGNLKPEVLSILNALKKDKRIQIQVDPEDVL